MFRGLVLLLLVAFPGLASAQPASEEAHADQHEHAQHPGLLGDYPMSREASGTAWVPESAPAHAVHLSAGPWSVMLHGFVTATFNHEGGRRGDQKLFSTNMLGVMTSREVGRGRLGLRLMGTLEPTMGADGYPLLLQTGETADGTNPLIDRQHPHDLFMELAATYSHPVGTERSAFLYVAGVGEPALGPAAFMHRQAAVDLPLAPISHHFLDSTHVSFGVVTLGLAMENVKLEGSIFNGREPDEARWGLESGGFDSYSGRITVHPSADWSVQVSAGHLDEPETLHANQDILRLTASVTYNRPLSNGNWQSTVAWGRNKRSEPPLTSVAPTNGFHTHALPGGTGGAQSALILESAATLARRHTILGRYEFAQKDELFGRRDPRHSTVYDVSRLSVGYLFDLPGIDTVAIGLGAAGSLIFVPDELRRSFGDNPAAFTGYVRVRLGS